MNNLVRLTAIAGLFLAGLSYAKDTTYRIDQLPELKQEAQHATVSERVTARFTRSHYRQFERGWTCPGLTLSASICGKTYRVEGHLQLATLRELDVLKPAAREFFAGVFRGEFSHEADGSARPGWMTWIDPKTDRPDFHVPTAFGVFELLD